MSTGMDGFEDVDLGQHAETVEGGLSEEFTFVDAEQPDSNRVITVIAGPEKAKVQVPRTLTCTMSTVIADMMQKALKEQLKNSKAIEHVPRFDKGGVMVKDDDNILDFVSHGQSRLRNPTLVLPDFDPATIRALAYWLSNPEADILSDRGLRRVLRFDIGEDQDNKCGCGRGALFPLWKYCPEHEPTIAISLICFAEKFQMVKLRNEVIKALLRSCGIQEIIEKHFEGRQYSHSMYPRSVTFRRWAADDFNIKNAIQFFHLTSTVEPSNNSIAELTGAEYKISGLRKGKLEGNDGGVEHWAMFWGGFEVYCEDHSGSQGSLVSRLMRAVIGN